MVTILLILPREWNRRELAAGCAGFEGEESLRLLALQSFEQLVDPGFPDPGGRPAS